MPAVSTKVSIKVGKKPQREYRDIQTYSLDSNVLTLVDCCSFQLVNPIGARTDEIKLGDPVTVHMSDPRVGSNKEVQILTGLVTGISQDSTDNGGTVLNLDVSDLGWHLVNNCGPLFKNISYITFAELLRLVLDASWGFVDVRTENDTNRRLDQGKALIGTDRKDALIRIPPICFEAGDSVADKIITYATRAKMLVNVSSDGYLQIFSPNYGQSFGPSQDPNSISGADYTFHYHAPNEAARAYNNVRKASVRQVIDGIYTDITCIGTAVNLTGIAYAQNDFHPGTFSGMFQNHNVLPFKRNLTFTDGDALGQATEIQVAGVDATGQSITVNQAAVSKKPNKMATDHATRKYQRGLFDAYTIEYQVEGHVMGGVYITPDSMAGINDTINKINGNFYISARRFQRSANGGTTTTVTLHKPNLLHGGST